MRNKEWILNQLKRRLEICLRTVIVNAQEGNDLSAERWQARAEELTRTIKLIETMEAL